MTSKRLTANRRQHGCVSCKSMADHTFKTGGIGGCDGESVDHDGYLDATNCKPSGRQQVFPMDGNGHSLRAPNLIAKKRDRVLAKACGSPGGPTAAANRRTTVGPCVPAFTSKAACRTPTYPAGYGRSRRTRMSPDMQRRGQQDDHQQPKNRPALE